MSLSQAQTTETQLHPLLFLQEKQHQSRGENVTAITGGSVVAGGSCAPGGVWLWEQGPAEVCGTSLKGLLCP